MRLFWFEHRSQPIAPVHTFVRRWVSNIAIVVTVIIAWLIAGAIGYHCVESRAWFDAFHDAAMTMSGIGPVHDPQLGGGKLFASLYAIISPLLLGVAVGYALAHPFHRVLHHLHVGDGVSASNTRRSGKSSRSRRPPSA